MNSEKPPVRPTAKTTANSASKASVAPSPSRQSKTILWIIVAIVILAAIIVPITFVVNNNNKVATLGGMSLKVADYKFYLYQIIDNVEYSVGISDSEIAEKTSFWLTQNSDGVTYAEYYKNLAMEQLKKISASMLKAKEAGMSVESDTKTAYDNYMLDIVNNKFSGSRINADKAMVAQYGSPLDTIKRILLDQELAYSYDQSFYNSRLSALKGQVTYDEAKAKYDESPASYNTFTVRHILILTIDPSTGKALETAEVTAAKTKADEYKARIEAGESMADMVPKYSQDTGTKDKGGNFSFTKLSTNIDANIMSWAQSAEIGKVAVVQSSSGYHVIVLEKSETTAFDTITDDIKTEIAALKVEEEIAAFPDAYEFKINSPVYSKISVIR